MYRIMMCPAVCPAVSHMPTITKKMTAVELQLSLDARPTSPPPYNPYTFLEFATASDARTLATQSRLQMRPCI